MPAVAVPDLKEKLALLRGYSTHTSWEALGLAFGVPAKTLQYWAHGSARREPGRLPDDKLPVLIQLVGEVLPGARPPDEARVFALGPAAALEEELRTGASVSLLGLLASEARRDTVSLIPRGDDLGLVEVEAEDQAPCPRLKLGEYFRLAVRRRLRSGYVVALQHAQRVWALLPMAVSAQPPATILVPGVNSRGDPSFMRERRDAGRHRFVCLETAAPPPASLLAAGRDEVGIDKRVLDGLAAFYLAQPRRARACHMIVVEFVAANAP